MNMQLTLISQQLESFGFERGTQICLNINPEIHTKIQMAQHELTINAPTKTAAFIALGNMIIERKFEIKIPDDQLIIQNRCIMLDASRNAVPKIDYLQSLLFRLSLCGLNQFCLYTEDTYPSDIPLMGYGRGAYSFEELKALDDYAFELGIEIFPCIQVLGHFEQLLRYSHYSPLQDTPRILNTNLESTYDFIEKLIKNAISPYRSKKIHVGLDEPWFLGRGKSWDFQAPKTAAERYTNHLNKVNQICKSLDLEMMFWADYVLGHSGETALNEDQRHALTKEAKAIYWDYDTTDKEIYRKNITSFKSMGYMPTCAPSAHNYGRFFPDYDLFKKTALPFIDVMHEEKIEHALLTLWGDDGHECLNEYAVPEMVHYLLGCRNLHNHTEIVKGFIETFSAFTLEEIDLFSNISEPKIIAQNVNTPFAITGKMILWDDPFHRFIFRLIGDDREQAKIKLGKLAHRPIELRNQYLRFAKNLANLCSKKCEVIDEMMIGWRKKDSEILLDTIRDIAYLQHFIENCHSLYRILWMEERKFTGLEIIDIRFAHLMNRLKILEATLFRYTNGEFDDIEALNDSSVPPEITRMDLYFYNKIFTRCFQLWT